MGAIFYIHYMYMYMLMTSKDSADDVRDAIILNQPKYTIYSDKHFFDHKPSKFQLPRGCLTREI